MKRTIVTSAWLVAAMLNPLLASAADEPAAEAPAETVATGEPEAAPAEAAAAEAAEASAPAASEAAAPASTSPAAAAEAPAAADAAAGRPDLIASGERISVRDGDLTIVPPKGWEVHQQLADLTLLMQKPHEEGVKYQRTIQVASFAGARYVDETTAKEYEEVITHKFAATSAAIEGYRIRNHLVTDMTDGRQGLLFYSEFTLDGVALMQAHILVSSASRHYLMTYTDIAEHFESEAANQFLTEAWDAMTSVQLSGASPARFQEVTYGGIAVGVLLVLAICFIFARRWFAARQYRDYADGDSDDALAASAPATRLDSGSTTRLEKTKRNSKRAKVSVEPSRLSRLDADESMADEPLASMPASDLPRPSKGKKAKSAGKHLDDDESSTSAPISIASRPASKAKSKASAKAEPPPSSHALSEPAQSFSMDLDDDEAV